MGCTTSKAGMAGRGYMSQSIPVPPSPPGPAVKCHASLTRAAGGTSPPPASHGVANVHQFEQRCQHCLKTPQLGTRPPPPKKKSMNMLVQKTKHCGPKGVLRTHIHIHGRGAVAHVEEEDGNVARATDGTVRVRPDGAWAGDGGIEHPRPHQSRPHHARVVIRQRCLPAK